MNSDSDIVIHLGLHRTGTTFLQKEVFEKLTGVNYMFDDSLHRINIKEGTNLISNEGLSLSMPHSYTHRLKLLDYIHRLFPNAKIIIGLREKNSWLKSCYYRYVLSYGKLKFNDYKDHFSPNDIDYNHYLKEIQKRFSSVYIYRFEDLKSEPKQVVKEICNFIGVDIPDYKIVKRNASLGERQIEMVRKLNHTGLKFIIIPIIKFIQRTPT